jgi:hypothetical protein
MATVSLLSLSLFESPWKLRSASTSGFEWGSGSF